MLREAFEPLPDGAGPVGLLSSDEFTAGVAPFDVELLARARAGTVAIIPAADPANRVTIERFAREHFEPLGAVVTHDVDAADVLYLPGGDPRVALSSLCGTESWERIRARWLAGAALVGSSAGAMALCEHCLVPRPGADKPTTWTQGLGALPNVGLAVHATTDAPRLDGRLDESSRSRVVAIDDATGIVLHGSDEPVVIGPGRALIVENPVY